MPKGYKKAEIIADFASKIEQKAFPHTNLKAILIGSFVSPLFFGHKGRGRKREKPLCPFQDTYAKIGLAQTALSKRQMAFNLRHSSNNKDGIIKEARTSLKKGNFGHYLGSLFFFLLPFFRGYGEQFLQSLDSREEEEKGSFLLLLPR